MPLDARKSNQIQGPFVIKAEQSRPRRTGPQPGKDYACPGSQPVWCPVLKAHRRIEKGQEFLLGGVIFTVNICQGSLARERSQKHPNRKGRSKIVSTDNIIIITKNLQDSTKILL